MTFHRIVPLACLFAVALIAASSMAIPPKGNDISDADRAELEKGVAQLGERITMLTRQLQGKPRGELLPDVIIYHKAVQYPLVYHELIDVAKAKAVLADGMERAKQLADSKAPWLIAGGPRGYVSRIDGSVQPYMLTVPPNYDPASRKKYRVDFFCHGRNEKLNELAMITPGKGGQSVGATTDKFLVFPYGRYCCANKLAGEIDLLEILDSLKKQYPVDEDRLLISGFSMGGAACWQFAVHYSDLWAAAAPGAGFAESQYFLKLAEKNELDQWAWYQRKLWNCYDCTTYAVNLAQLPTIAYNGDIDGQKQAADVMEKAMAEEGLKLERIIGPNTGHKYEPGAKAELDKRIDALVAKGRVAVPEQVRFATATLRYNRMFWVTVDGLEHHWSQAKVTASITDRAKAALELKTQNVTALTLNFAAGQSPFAVGAQVAVTLDGAKFSGPTVTTDKSWHASFVKRRGYWEVAKSTSTDEGLHKRHGLQGPIDDAFMDSFLVVKPTGKPMHEKTGAWVAAECARAIEQWRAIFRGDARVKTDAEVSDADISVHNLVLWGDPSSNKLIARILGRLPVRWDAHQVGLGDKRFPADHHVAVLIFPNPLNPKRYVVLNSGFTFREADSANNARQIPKLPDYAVIDVETPPTDLIPGNVVDAGFFGERWEVQANGGQ